ncbi:MAG: hypothetical protein ACTHK8_11205 [Ginsengibacter sp.]|jgi:hypothetical protein
MSALKILSDYTSKIFYLLFSPDSNQLNNEFEDIMSNETDKKKYMEAIKNVKKTNKEQRVKLSSGETLVVAP